MSRLLSEVPPPDLRRGSLAEAVWKPMTAAHASSICAASVAEYSIGKQHAKHLPSLPDVRISLASWAAHAKALCSDRLPADATGGSATALLAGGASSAADCTPGAASTLSGLLSATEPRCTCEGASLAPLRGNGCPRRRKGLVPAGGAG